jgi:hypothetical protein
MNSPVYLADSNLQDPDGNFDRSISTTDLISWSFQIARGMDYLVSKKVSLSSEDIDITGYDSHYYG